MTALGSRGGPSPTRLGLGAALLLCVVGACAGAKPSTHERPSSAKNTPAPAASASSTYPYLEFDPDTRPPPEPRPGDAGASTSDASGGDAGKPKVYPPPPTCKAVATTAPLSVDGGEKLVDSPSDPRLVSLRQYTKRLFARKIQCSVERNDGRLFNLDCATYYINADGNVRPGGVEGHLFEFNGRRFEPVPAKKLLPGAKSHAAALQEVCDAEQPELYSKLWLGRESVTFVAGLSPMDQGGCELRYAEHADWVGCGPFAYLAGYAPRAPAPAHALPEPLGWDGGHVMSRIPSQRALVKVINSRLDAFRASLGDSDTSECEVELTTNQVFSARCTKNYEQAMSLNYSVQTGAEIDIDTLIATAGPRLAKAAVADCNRQYHKQPKTEYELFSKSSVSLHRDDLTTFQIRASSVNFLVELELQYRDGSTSKRSATCRAAFPSAGLSLKKLGAIPSGK